MRTINWGESFTLEEVEALKNGEEFILLFGGTPISCLSMSKQHNVEEVEL